MKLLTVVAAACGLVVLVCIAVITVAYTAISIDIALSELGVYDWIAEWRDKQ